MNNEDLYQALGDINEHYIKEAHDAKPKKQIIWGKWLATAACLVLLISVGFPHLSEIFGAKGGLWQKDPARPINLIEFNGIYYEAIDMADTKLMNRYHLPHQITMDMVGRSLGKGLDGMGNPSEETFFIYAPYEHIQSGEIGKQRPQKAVYVVQNKQGDYAFALFCNHIGYDSNSYTEASELLAVYGIDSAEDIASIQIGTDSISDQESIRRIFDLILHAPAMGNDDFQELVYGHLTEDEELIFQQEQASARPVRITTREGLVTNQLLYYEDIGYLHWGLTYYRLEEPLG